MNNKPRKWWIAGLLSLLEPGLGQIYNGQARKGIIFILLQVMLIPLLMLSLNSSYVLIYLSVIVVLTLIYYILVFTETVTNAKKHGSEYRLKKYNKIAIYLGTVILLTVFSTSIQLLVKNHYVQAFKILAGSMEPTLLIGDHILVDRGMSAQTPIAAILSFLSIQKTRQKILSKGL